MSPRFVGSAYDRGSKATFVGNRMGDQKFIISSSSVLRKARYPVGPAVFVVVSTHQAALGGGLWPVLLVGNP
jgi:hypothetical protein